MMEWLAVLHAHGLLGVNVPPADWKLSEARGRWFYALLVNPDQVDILKLMKMLPEL